MKQNIYIFAVLVNLVGIWLSGIGVLSPITAAVVHNVSSLIVVINSARLLNYRYAQTPVDPTSPETAPSLA